MRDGNRFFLCDCREGVEQHFIAHGKGVDAFLLKDHAYAEKFELPHIFQCFLDIAGKSGDRLRKDQIDLFQLAHCYHAVEVVSFFCGGAGDALISEDVDKLPVPIGFDMPCKVANLCLIGIILIRRIGGNTAVCSDSFVFHRLAGHGGDDGYCCHVSTPFCGWL